MTTLAAMYEDMRLSRSKQGKPPGSLIYVGPKRDFTPDLQVVTYGPSGCARKAGQAPGELLPGPEEQAAPVTWVRVRGVHDPELVRSVGERFGLHPMLLEDVMQTNQRPKLEEYEGVLFIVVRALGYDAETGAVSEEQLSLVLKGDTLITFQESATNLLDELVARVEAGKGRLRRDGADYLTFAVLDTVVDASFGTVSRIGDAIEGLEDAFLEEGGAPDAGELYRLKRELIYLRKTLRPLRDLAGRLARGGLDAFDEETQPFLRDVYDNVLHALDAVETLRELLSILHEEYMTLVGFRTNEIMRVLTVIATIFMPLTFIAGVYGMNFERMPELGWAFGYPAVLVLMFAVGAGMYWWFVRKRWL